jgi:hypothetical protein
MVYVFLCCAGLCMQGVTKSCGHILGAISRYQNNKKFYIIMCPETFNLSTLADTEHLY